MTVVVLIGFFLMLLAPCVIAIVGGRERKEKAVAERPVRVAAAADEELDLPAREHGDVSHLEPATAAAPRIEMQAVSRMETAVAVSAAMPKRMVTIEEPVSYGTPQRVQRRAPDLKSIVAQAESEAMVAHAMAAQANAAALAATARAAQARAQAAAEHAVAANQAAANHAAAVREREMRVASDEAAEAEQPLWPELTVAVASDGDSQRAA